MHTIKKISLIALASSLGCTFIARGPDQYRADTREVLETKNAAVKACYDAELANNPGASGKVTVNFTVEEKTGVLKDVAVDPDGTTAPPSLSQCVVNAVDGLVLTPEDQRAGIATYTYRFEANTPAPAAETPAA